MALTTPIVAAGHASSPLLTDAPLCLLAGRVVAYQPGDPWKNLGTAGDILDAEVVSQPDFVNEGPGGPGFKREIPEPTPPERPRVGTFENRMFDIAGSLLAPGDTDPWTVTIATTPLYPHPESVRYLWKYSDTSLPPSPAGLVIENVATFPNGAEVGHGLIAAIYNGPLATPPTFLGGANPLEDIQRTRQVLALRYDPEPVPPATDGAVTVWRNGETFADSSPITEAGPWIDTTDFRIGSGQICHAVLWHDRALTDTEMAELSDLLLR